MQANSALEQFIFSEDAKFSLSTWNLLSYCCGAIMFGEPINMPSSGEVFGRCKDCLEVTGFNKE